MTHKVNDRVELKKKGAAPKGSCGTVKKVYGNGRVKVRITHRPNCDELEFPFTIVSIHPDELQDSHCG